MYFELAKRNLERAKVRSLLAVVGIFIGVMAVSAIGIFGESLKATVLSNFEDVANELIVSPNAQEGYRYIAEKDINAIKKLPYVDTAIAIKSDYLLVEAKKRRAYMVVYGMDEKDVGEMFKAEKGVIRLKGSCVIGKRIADAAKIRVNSKIAINGREFRVSAILEDSGARFDINPNSAIFLSPKDFEKVSNAGYTMVIVRAESIEKVEKLKKEIEKRLNSRDEKVVVFDLKIILDRIEEAFSQINTFLMAIASISLLVAGVSILNIMLMSTIERTKEIGVMRAIGAYRTTILRIFLLEALILGIIGSVTGGMLSIIAGYLIDYAILKDVTYVFQPSTLLYIILGFSVGVATSIISGLYPAWKASRLEPIEALRFE
ncbi:ABC transporter permease [Archaeoglobus neptunius]|uniref:ABC transporter permease n=1 Tax=Archaeoglobus neptunius TaxID=2798580 RepID=UPI0019262C8D|nr:ABC transporter permease [Archaeoglobus neptunius]